jgi:hypothetical protein
VSPELALALLREAEPISFCWRNGEAGRHFGWVAQDWAGALDSSGIDAGLVVRLAPDSPDGELGLRPDQITAVLHAAMLSMVADVEALTKRLGLLEAAAT